MDQSYAFRTPSLRNLRHTAPYMHNGVFNSLDEVLIFYQDASDGFGLHQDIKRNQLDSLMDKIDLIVPDMNPIISFLNTLNDDDFDRKIPSSVPSGLAVGGNIE